MHKVIFACVHNAGRSQMAAAFFNEAADPTKAFAVSAGTAPGPHVHTEVMTAMREAGIDLSTAVPRLLTPEVAEGASWLITMGCGESCPFVPGAQIEDWPVADPKEQSIEAVRDIRNEIRDRVHAMVKSRDWARKE
jgi:arsenate reductase (thioredoxin)